MHNEKKVLVLGATGAMGRYLVPALAEMGYRVDGVTLDECPADSPRVRYLRTDARDAAARRKILENGYDGIVDFMIYNTGDLAYYLPAMLDATAHYIYLSTYRIYDNREHPVRETSPRLIDSADSVLLRNSDDYSVYKARGENIVRARSAHNWTIVRPAITYSQMRYQLVTLEAPDTVGRARAGKPVVLPESARFHQATMSWGGDVAQMIARLLFNEKALGETFSVCTAEHRSWDEIAEYYRDLCGLEPVWVDQEDYLRILCADPWWPGARWQLEYDRLFDRIMDNSKVLAATGLRQSELLPLYDGLKREIARCPENFPWPVNRAMDEFLAGRHSPSPR